MSRQFLTEYIEISADVSPASIPVVNASGSADSMNSQLYGAISTTESVGTAAHTMESDDQEMYSEEDVLAGDIITTDEVSVLLTGEVNLLLTGLLFLQTSPT